MKFVWDKNSGRWIPRDLVFRPSPPSGPMIMRDIESYKSMITGEVISSRSHHREHLNIHGMVEVGNEKSSVIGGKRSLPPIDRDIKESIDQLKSGVADSSPERVNLDNYRIY